MTLGGIGYHLANIVLRVVSAHGARVVLVAEGASTRPPVVQFLKGAPGGKRGESRVFLDFDAPAGTVGEVPVEAVHLEVGQGIELFLHKLLVGEMARHIEVHAPVGKPGSVVDGDGGQGLAVAVVEQLQQGLYAVEESRLGTGREGYSLFPDFEAVAFGFGNDGAVAKIQTDAAISRCFVGKGYRAEQGPFEAAGKSLLALGGELGVELGLGREGEGSPVVFDRTGHGYEVYLGLLGGAATDSAQQQEPRKKCDEESMVFCHVCTVN